MALKFEITGDNRNVLSSFDGVREGVRRTAREVEQQGMGIEEMFKRIGEAAGIAFSADMAKRFVSTIMSVRGQFQQLEIAFSTMLQSEEKANALMKQLVDTAAKTPFDLKGVAEGAKQLLAYGTAAEDINETITRLGDIAAGLSIPLGDLVYLFGTTMTQGRMFTMDLRQFMGRGIPMAEELAKQFGVTKDEVAGLVTAGKVSAEAVKKAIWSMTDEGSKFGGLMAKQSASITGQISNIEDAIDEMFNEIGKSSEGAINAGLSGVSLLVENWETVGQAILAAAEAFGIYKATMMAMSAYNNAATNIAYDAEIAALQSVIPLKEQSAQGDLEQAVASGRLSAEKAEQIAILREEAQAHLQLLTAKEAEAKAAFDAATTEAAQAGLDLEAAQEQYDAMQQAYDQALALGDATKIETAAEELNTAEIQLNTASSTYNSAAKKANAANTELEAASKAKNTAATQIETAANVGDTASTGILTQAKIALKRAIDAVNASFLASPYFWAAAAIVGLTYTVYKLVTAESEHERAVRKANEAMEEQDKKLGERRDEIDKLVRTIQDETASEYEKVRAYNRLKEIAPQITEEYSRQELASMKAAESQAKFNESLEDMEVNDVKKNIAELQKNINGFDKTLQESLKNAGPGQGAAAISEMAYKQLHVWEEELKIYQDKLAEMEEARAQAIEESRPIEIRIKEAQENVDAMSNIKSFYEEAMDLAEHWQEANDSINFATGKSNVEEFIQTTEQELEDLRRQIEDNPMDVRLQMEYQEKQKIYDNIISMKSEMDKTGTTTIPLRFKMDYQSFLSTWTKMNNSLQRLFGKTAEGGATTLQQDYDSAQARYLAAQKKLSDIENNRAKYTKEEYVAAISELKTASDAFKDVGGDVSGKSGKKSSKGSGGGRSGSANDKNSQLVKQIQEERRYQEELAKIQREAEDARIDANIAAIQNEGERERAEQDEQHRRSIRQIELQAEEMRKAIYQHNKTVWENSHKNSPYELTEEGKKGWESIQLSVEQQSIINAQIDKENLEYDRIIKKRYLESQSVMRDYLKEYGSIEQQRLAITQEYEQKILDAMSPTERAALMLERNQALKDFDAKQFEEEIDWAGIFSDLEGHTREYLVGLRDQLQNVLAKGTLEPEQMAVVQEKLRDINSEISKQNGLFQFVGDRQREHARLLQVSEDAQVQLNKAKKEESDAQKEVLDTTEQIRDILASVGMDRDVDIDDELLSAFDKNSEEYKRMSELLTILRVGEGNLAKARRETEKATRKAKNAEDASKRKSAQAVADWFADAQQFITEKGIDQIPDLLNSLGLGKAGEKASQGLAGFNDAAGAAADYASGNYIGAAVKGISAVKNFGRMLGIGGGNEKEVAETTERLTKANEVLADRISDLTEVIGNSAGQKAISAYEAALEAQKELQKNNMEILRAQMGYHSSHHSNAHYASDREIRELFGNSRSTLSRAGYNFNINGLESIYGLTPEELKAIKDFAPQLWSYLTEVGKYDKSEYWEQVVEQAGRTEELTEQINNNLTQTSFDSLRDSFLDALTDMESSSEDFAKSFEEMMFKAVMNSLVLNDEFDAWLQNWQKKYAEAVKNNNTNELEALREEAVKKRDLLIQERDRYVDLMDYDAIMKDQSATSHGIQNITQDQADQIIGRITAVQIAVEQGNVQRDNMAWNIIASLSNLNTLTSASTQRNAVLLEIRDMMITSNGFLEDIAKYSKTVSQFDVQLNKLVRVTEERL